MAGSLTVAATCRLGKQLGVITGGQQTETGGAGEADTAVATTDNQVANTSVQAGPGG